MGQEKNAENIPFLRSTQPKSTERVPVVELSGLYNWPSRFCQKLSKNDDQCSMRLWG